MKDLKETLLNKYSRVLKWKSVQYIAPIIYHGIPGGVPRYRSAKHARV